MLRKLALTTLAVVSALAAAIIVTYALPVPEEGTQRQSLVTLELTRYGQRTFKSTVPAGSPMTSFNHDTGLGYGFVPTVVDRNTVSVDFFALDYDSNEDQWRMPEDGEPLETFEVSARGPSFTTALSDSNNYEIKLVSIEPLKKAARAAD